jgi:DNA-binding transcriptional regulator PaaX
MGMLEEESKKRSRRKNLQKIILDMVASAGILSIALLAPNALKILREFGYKTGKRQGEIIGNSRRNLVKAGLMEYDGRFLRLTPKGEAKLRQLKVNDFKLQVPKKWDRKWRIIIFDIKEERRNLREKIRRTFNLIGFVRLQDSVWVYPYDCENLVTLLKADFKIGKDLLYLIVDAIENDKNLKKEFDLGD